MVKVGKKGRKAGLFCPQFADGAGVLLRCVAAKEVQCVIIKEVPF